MLIAGLLLLVIYLTGVLISGARILRACIAPSDVAGLHLPASLMVGFFFSFVVFILTSTIAPGVAIYASVTVPVAVGMVLFLVRREFVGATFPSDRRSWLIVVGITWLLLLAQYGIECSPLLIAAARGEGVIYQDIIYHGGIARSLALNGFPAQNLQFSGENIGYHIFSHFIAAQFLTLIGASVQTTYTFVIAPMFFLVIALSAYSYIYNVYGSYALNPFIAVVVIYVSLYSVFMLSGTPDPSIPLYLSHSYQLQIASLLIIFGYLHLISDGSLPISAAVSGLLSLLLAQAMLIKGSSLPLVMVGFGAWIGCEAIVKRRITGAHIAMLTAFAMAAGMVYVIFYYYPGYSVTSSDFTIFISRLYDLDLARETVDLLGDKQAVLWTASIVSILSYRIVLAFLPFRAYGGAILAAFLSGVVMYLCIRYAANYYLLAIVCVANMYCLTKLAHHWNRISKVVRVAVVVAVVLSLYPLSSGGRPSAAIMLSRKAANYYPLTREKQSLYEELRTVSNSESLIFTTSLAGAPSGVPDNYYPAALSGRQFYLGGFRLKVQELPGLEERLAFVEGFTPVSPDDRRRLEELGVDFVLIETADLESSERRKTLDAVSSSLLYRLVFQNGAGVILAL